MFSIKMILITQMIRYYIHLSLEKIARMYKRAVDNGFASYAEA